MIEIIAIVIMFAALAELGIAEIIKFSREF